MDMTQFIHSSVDRYLGWELLKVMLLIIFLTISFGIHAQISIRNILEIELVGCE